MRSLWILGIVLAEGVACSAEDEYYPPPESKGGWRTLVTKNAAPSPQQKAEVLDRTGLDADGFRRAAMTTGGLFQLGSIPGPSMLTLAEAAAVAGQIDVAKDFLAKSKIPAAEHDRIAATVAVAMVRLALQQRLAAAFEQYTNARFQVEKYQREILPNAEESLKLTNSGYRQGEFSYLMLLTAQRTFFRTNLT